MANLPKSMVAPSQKRSVVWRGGILQIMITRACDLSCYHCSQGSNLAGKPVMMTPEQFDKACESLHGYFGVVGMFGGNPAVHPQFGELCKIMRGHFPFEQRGLWCNNLRGKGADARITFNPAHSNLNVHMNSDAHEEFIRDWPESRPYLKGLERDSVHSSPWVSMIDRGIPEEERCNFISKCDINQFWSALIGVFRGELRAYFCEIAYSMAALHQDNPNWAKTGHPIPDTGLPVVPGWWRLPMEAYNEQVQTHCHHCGIPTRRQGQHALNGDHEEFSETHEFIARPKVRDRPVQLVEIGGLPVRPDRPATQYLPMVTPGYSGF
jgi:Radical SAM superfamily